jgi:RimJ/RimL family protein N-acetyltransferase
MSTTVLRDARAEDAPALCAAEQAVVRAYDGLLVSEPDELQEAAFVERIASLADGRGKYLVVERNAELLAHASLWPMGLRKVSHVLRLDMCIHLGHWQQGHGQALLEALLVWARENPCAYKVELLVRATNLPAVSLYRRAGFTEEGRMHRRVRLRDGQFVDDLSMALHLRENAGELQR